jgi:tyrosine-protein kinase
MGNARIGFGSLLRRWWVVIVLATAGGALVAYVYGSRATPTYEASAELLVEAPGGSAGTTQAAELAPTYAELATSTPVLAFALRRTEIPVTLDELRANARGESDQDTRLIKIRARNSDPTRAIALANGLARGVRWYVALPPAPSTPEADVRARPRVRVVEGAHSANRIRPRSLLLLEFGAMAGLFGALAFVLVAEARSQRVKDEADLVEIGSLAVLGEVNGGSPGAAGSSLDPTRAFLDTSASYRRLATQIAMANDEEPLRSLLVVGAEGAKGSATVAAKLALTHAGDGRRVVLADFGEGDVISRLFQIGEDSGGGKLVRRSGPLGHGGTTLDCFALRSGVPVVLALPRFDPRGLALEEAEDLVTLLSADADLLIVHGPCPSRSRGALTWARATKATLIVVRAEHTSRANVHAAVKGLEPVGANLVGAVLQT